MLDDQIIQIELNNFRNHKSLKLDFNSKIINIIGKNGVGKTSILESFSVFHPEIALRDKKIVNILHHEQKNLRVLLQFSHNSIINELLFQYNLEKNQKKIHLNGSSIRKYSELNKYINLICFSPQLYAKFLHSTQFRRQFFDNITHSFFFNHLQQLHNYNYLRQERQKILKKINYDQSWMQIIEKKMSNLAIQINENREKCIKILKKNMQINNYQILLQGKFENYLSNIDDINEKVQIFQNILQKNRIIDLQINQTTVGPHRTQIEMFFHNNSFDQCSTGEQKKFFLSILLEQAKEKIALQKIHPILLFDDIVSQFDYESMKKIIAQIEELEVQCFITYVEQYPSIIGQIINL